MIIKRSASTSAKNFFAGIAVAYGAYSPCIAQTVGQSGKYEAAPQTAPISHKSITISGATNVCVAVKVDQRIWPRPITADTQFDLSRLLASELRSRFEQQGGAAPAPGATNEPRFANNGNGRNPVCQDVETDIFVTVEYNPLPSGDPFVSDFRIAQGTRIKSGSQSTDIFKQIRDGERVYFSKIDPINTAVIDDIRKKAVTLIHLINIPSDD